MDDLSHLGSGDDSDSDVPASPGRDARLTELRSAVERGIEDIKAGRVADPELALSEIEAMLDELEAAKKAAG